MAENEGERPREMRKTLTTTAGTAQKILPMVPGTKNMGRKATTLVRTEKVTGSTTLRAPRVADRREGRPRSFCW